MKLAVVDDDLFLQHVEPPNHPERRQRLQAAREGVSKSRLSDQVLALPPRDANRQELRRVHSEEHLQKLEQCSGLTGYLDADTYYSPASWDAARRASGGALNLVDGLLAGEFDYGFAICRPPGHHATRDRAMGFCLLNHIAVAAAHALANGAERVAIVDFDVHHGNGTEEIFYESSQVLYASVHQSPQYPGTGLASDIGAASGRGHNVNIPLASGATDSTYVECFERVICPIIEQFQPRLLLLSAGYDGHQRDPLGGMAISSAGYGALTRLLLSAMPERGVGQTCFMLEGGYDLEAIREGVTQTLDALAPEEAASDTVSAESGLAQRELTAAHRQQIQAAARVQAEFWNTAS